MTDLAILVLRLGLGIMFAAHGAQKALGLFSGPGIAGFSKMLSGMGFTPAIFWAYLAANTELIGGLFLILGICVRSSAVMLLILISVAALKVHLAKGFFLSGGGFEYAFIIAVICIALIFLGAGKFAIIRKF